MPQHHPRPLSHSDDVNPSRDQPGLQTESYNDTVAMPQARLPPTNLHAMTPPSPTTRPVASSSLLTEVVSAPASAAPAAPPLLDAEVPSTPNITQDLLLNQLVEPPTVLPLARSISAAPIDVIPPPPTHLLGLGRSVSLKTKKTSAYTMNDTSFHPYLPDTSPYTSSIASTPSSKTRQSDLVQNLDATRLNHATDSLVNASLVSATSSPGALTPTTSPHRTDVSQSDTLESYPSPYLHYTQPRAPKE